MVAGDDGSKRSPLDGETLIAKGVGPEADLGPKFEVLGSLGRGGMGSVLKVRHRAMNRIRAVKLLHLEGAAKDSEIMERFRREATIASDLSHPNIVQIYDFDFTPTGEPYIAMEYIEGEDLHQLLRRTGSLDLQRVVQLLTGVADALDRVHELGVVHRDLKPANLFVAPNNTVKILDFGISHVEWDGPSLTQTGDILGTPMYMSPEQLRGDRVDARADVYSLGAVAYELLTGHQPIESTTPAQLIGRILEDTPRPAAEWITGLPAHVVAALARSLAKDPAERFATAGEFIRALAGPQLVPEVERMSAALLERPTAIIEEKTEMQRGTSKLVIAAVIAGIVAATVVALIIILGK